MSYSNWKDLSCKEQEGEDYRVLVLDKHSPITIMAPHGGGIEPGTSEIAYALSDNRFNLYLFEGIKPSGNYSLHVPSTKFNEPQCVDLISRSKVVVAIHGCTDKDKADIYLGGLNILKLYMLQWLIEKGFRATHDFRFGGVSEDNICNRNRPGVQIELTRSFREWLLVNPKELNVFTTGLKQVLLNPSRF